MERNQEASVYVGNLDERVNEGLVWELMLQAGPVVNVFLPKDRVSGSHQNYGFVEFMTSEDADYAIKIMNMIKLYGKPIRVNKASGDTKKEADIGANLFIGNLDPEVDEKMLFDTFSAFGRILNTPKVAREVDSGISRGYGFVSFGSFDSADAAIEAMNNRFLSNKPIQVSYAMKRDGKGELHGSGAERTLAQQAAIHAPQMRLPAQGPETAASPMGGNAPVVPPQYMQGAPMGYMPPPMMVPMIGQPMPPPVHPGMPYPGPPPMAYQQRPPPPPQWPANR